MGNPLNDLLDLTKLQDLLANFQKLTGIGAAIVSPEGEIIVSSARPALCQKFYDMEGCDTGSCHLSRLTLLYPDGNAVLPATNVCSHGLWDAARLITVQSEQIGALLIGQVFCNEPDLGFYRSEAERLGFDTELFLQAVQDVPIVQEAQFKQAIEMMQTLTSMLADLAMSKLKAMEKEQIANQHAAQLIIENYRKRAQLKLYAMDTASCSDLLDTALEEALGLTDSSIGYIYEYDEDARLFTLYAWSQSVMPQCSIIQKQTVYQLDKTGLWGEAVRQRKAIITNDYITPSTLKKGCPEGHVPLVRHMNLPIFKKGRIVAVIGVGNKLTDYTDEDVRHLELFINGVWNLVERKKGEDELLVAKELAEQSSKMKTELLANLSHELRTPLNGVIGGVQLLRFTELSEEQDEFLGIVEEAAANELTLVNNLLELVKLEVEGVQLEHAPFSLRQCIEEVVQVHEWTATSKEIVLQTQLPVDLPPKLIGDKVRIRQILHSLLGNAVKFTSKGSVTLGLAFEKGEDQQIHAHLSVTDTGIGIEPEKLERIFQQFIQSDMSNTREFGGLGLGLTICQRLASVMGGQIRVESRLGEGSTFILELLLELPAPELPATAGKQSLTILLVEDDHLSAMTGNALLSRLGHQVVTANNGEDAVKLCERKNFDLVLMDIHMPVMDGFEALQEIRKQEQKRGKPRIPVIAQTGYARWNYHESFLSAEFDGFIAKPLLREELEHALAGYCL